MNITNRHIVQK